MSCWIVATAWESVAAEATRAAEDNALKEYRRLERAQQAKLERDAADRLAAARIARDAAPPAMRPRHRENILPATRGGEGVRLSPNAGRKVGDSKRIKSIAIEHLARLVDRDYFAASDLLRSTSSSAFA